MTFPVPGSIGWVDLTVDDASRIRDFYRTVIGWSVSEVPMGGYSDFCLHPGPGAPPVAGICHNLGPNAGTPPVWLVYLTVLDLPARLEAVTALGGSVLVPPRSLGGGAMAIIRDPAGAIVALYEPPV